MMDEERERQAFEVVRASGPALDGHSVEAGIVGAVFTLRALLYSMCAVSGEDHQEVYQDCLDYIRASQGGSQVYIKDLVASALGLLLLAIGEGRLDNETLDATHASLERIRVMCNQDARERGLIGSVE